MDRFKAKIFELCSIDLRSLALFRIGLALIILGDLLVRVQDLTAHYTDEGVLPRAVLHDYIMDTPWQFSLYFLSGNWPFQLFLFIIAAIAALCLLVGYRTRIATAVSWFMLVSLFERNFMILQGGDFAFKMFLFWGMFLPLGAYWSIDAAKKKSDATQVLSIASFALLLQVCFIYWFAALFKNDPTWTSEGTAIWYSLSIEQYTTALGLELLNYPDLLRWLTFLTLYLEAFGPFFAFSPVWTGPLRFATAVVFICFHLIGLNLTMELAHFSYICTVGWLVFLPPWFWNKFTHEQSISYQKSGWLSNLLAAFFIIYIFFWNVFSLSMVRPPFTSDFLNNIARNFSIDQYWDMFSPAPLKLDGWYVIPAKLRDGSEIDLYTAGQPVKWEKPPLLSATYPNDRWRSFMMNMFLDDTDQEIYLESYGDYLCHHWNSMHAPEKQVISLNIYYMLRENDYEHQHGEYEKIDLWEHYCVDTESAPGSKN